MQESSDTNFAHPAVALVAMTHFFNHSSAILGGSYVFFKSGSS